MATTKQLSRADWHSYFEQFEKRHLKDDKPELVTIEVLSLEMGDQFEAEAAPLMGITYDPKDDVLDVAVGTALDHLVFKPKEIAVVEEDDGFVSAVDVLRDEGVHEILQISRGSN